jgi:Rod binding domain-containing protein
MSIPASTGTALPSSGLPLVNQALEPAWVRHGSASTQKSYQTALAFEQMLVEQLSQSLTATSGLGGEAGQGGESSSEGGSEATGSSPLSSMLPQALTSGVMNAGGLGLAAQMTHQLASAAGSTAAGASTGTSATDSVGATGGIATPAPTSTGTAAAGDRSAAGEVSATGGTGA